MVGAYAMMMVVCRSPNNPKRNTTSRSFIPLGKMSMYRKWVDFTANPTPACLGSFSGLPMQNKISGTLLDKWPFTW